MSVVQDGNESTPLKPLFVAVTADMVVTDHEGYQHEHARQSTIYAGAVGCCTFITSGQATSVGLTMTGDKACYEPNATLIAAAPAMYEPRSRHVDNNRATIEAPKHLTKRNPIRD